MAKGGSRRVQERRAIAAGQLARAQMSKRERTALHEAAHAIVAHAVGRRVVELWAVSKSLPVGHEYNDTQAEKAIDGFHRSEPDLGEDVYKRYMAGEDLSDEERKWCQQDAVIDLAGPYAERGLPEPGTREDLERFTNTARVLEQVDANREPLGSFRAAANSIVRQILGDLHDEWQSLASRLLDEGEMDEGTIAHALRHVARGSHEHLLAGLA
jgi:hypothetical protein